MTPYKRENKSGEKIKIACFFPGAFEALGTELRAGEVAGCGHFTQENEKTGPGDEMEMDDFTIDRFFGSASTTQLAAWVGWVVGILRWGRGRLR